MPLASVLLQEHHVDEMSTSEYTDFPNLNTGNAERVM